MPTPTTPDDIPDIDYKPATPNERPVLFDSKHNPWATAFSTQAVMENADSPTALAKLRELVDKVWEEGEIGGINSMAHLSILIVSGTHGEARACAELMGFEKGSWLFVDHYRVMLSHPNKSVYIYGTARTRKDYGAIEGLFIQGGHTVLDMNA